jgi:magnesium transporter
MLYLSQLLGAPIDDINGERVGKLTDILLPAAGVGQDEATYPGLLVIENEEDQRWRVAPAALERQEDDLRLRVPLESVTQQQTPHEEHEISFAHEILDKQVIDIEQKKAVRVNDVCFADDWRVLGIDNSTLALVRRVAPAWLKGAIGRVPPATIIPWERVELIGEQPNASIREPGQLSDTQKLVQRISSGHLADMHPADIAEIVHQLTPGQGARIIEGLDDETAADTMEEIDTERQRQILETIQPERAADILQAMGPDEAADLLSHMPEERAEELLRLMTPEESEEVQDLLGYEADTAGGLMTTDFIALNPLNTAEQALEAVRATIAEEDVRSAYVYCVDDETQDTYQLLGVVSLWDLLIASPTQTLQELMETDVVTVGLDSEARAVAETIAKYNLLAIPVVNEERMLEGIVTVDDALDVLLPPERRRKPTRMY